jgi:AcrR family transcriptional regulator
MAADTRRCILEAALVCFLEDGYEQATVSRIRERSGVSNGAFFHHFPSKEALADALYVEGIASFQLGLWEMLRRRPRSLRTAVRGTIAHQLSWVELNSDLARFVYMRGHLDWDSQGAAEVSALNAELSAAFRAWMAPFVERGELRVSSMLLISAIVNGPAHALARRWLAGQLEKPPTAYVEPLADAAWAALRGEPLEVRRQPAPMNGRITIELLDEDGTVTARGEHPLQLENEPKAASPPPTAKERR